MFGTQTNRRNLVLLGAVLMIGGCNILPKGKPKPPPPGPTDALPKDQQRHRIALLVPLTGPNAALGQSIANATTMALLDTQAKTIRITTYDTAAGPAAAAKQAMADGNRLVLGPLTGDEVAPVAAVTRAAKVPLLTYSGDASVAARDVFVLGTTPDNALQRVVRYAHGRGVKRFALLAPKGDYGTRAGAAYGAAVRAAGGTMVSSESYDRSNTSVVSAAQRLKSKGGFDAVLIADSPRFAALAAPRLKSAGAASPRILGTELWSGELCGDQEPGASAEPGSPRWPTPGLASSPPATRPGSALRPIARQPMATIRCCWRCGSRANGARAARFRRPGCSIATASSGSMARSGLLPAEKASVRWKCARSAPGG